MNQLDKLIQVAEEESLKYAALRGIEITLARTPGISSAYWRIAPKYYHRRFSQRFSDYDVAVKPCKRHWVNPDEITHSTGRQKKTGPGRRNDFIGVSRGNWDKNAKKFFDSILSKSIASKYKENIDWEETEFFEYCLNRIKSTGGYWHGCTNKEEMMNRFQKIDRIYADIQRNGYKTQPELRSSQRRLDYVDELLNEIVIDIGRDGELLFVDGRHRLTITKILQLERVPVVVDHRHESWLKKHERTPANSTGQRKYI